MRVICYKITKLANEPIKIMKNKTMKELQYEEINEYGIHYERNGAL